MGPAAAMTACIGAADFVRSDPNKARRDVQSFLAVLGLAGDEGSVAGADLGLVNPKEARLRNHSN